MKPIIDLHCDLLAYLEEDEKHTPDDPDSHCSLPLLKEGKVKLQALALFSQTKKGSTQAFMEQIKHFSFLLRNYSSDVCPSTDRKPSKIMLVPAIENASGLLEEDEDFEHLFDRMATLEKTCGPILYTSLTWNGKNRFGGGNETDQGLTHDGEMLLQHLAKKRIFIDLSHTSDPLAFDILKYIDRQNLPIQVLASHSNFRTICDVPRNLPNELAEEIFKRNGLIGLNVIRHFVGKSPEDLLKHIEQALSLGGENHLCLGCDFFGGITVPSSLERLKPFFFPGYENSSCYPRLIELLEKNIGQELTEKIAYKNAQRLLPSKFF